MQSIVDKTLSSSTTMKKNVLTKGNTTENVMTRRGIILESLLYLLDGNNIINTLL